MTDTAIKVENLSKQYRLGVIGHGTLYKDLQSWYAHFRGKEDPNARITEHIGPGLNGERFWALQDINFEVKQGEVLGIIGRNGAGKSTLLKILSRVTTPTTGRAKIKGRIASLLEVGTGFHQELTGRENIYLNGAILGMTKAEIDSKFDEIVDFSGLEKFIDTPVKRYSSGMYVRLAFAVAAHLEPEILLVDEVLAVGDVEFQKKCLGKMGDVAKGGRTILFVSHNMGAIRNLCRRTLLIDKGKLVIDAESSYTIAKYLDQNLLEGAVADEAQIQKRIEGKICRNNPFLHFKEIALLDEAGQARKSFNSDENIIVSVSFECLRQVED
ncbi:MAG: ABC transporter ATP-binding protein, partial [Planctomycetota bacterium]